MMDLSLGRGCDGAPYGPAASGCAATCRCAVLRTSVLQTAVLQTAVLRAAAHGMSWRVEAEPETGRGRATVLTDGRPAPRPNGIRAAPFAARPSLAAKPAAAATSAALARAAPPSGRGTMFSNPGTSFRQVSR